MRKIAALCLSFALLGCVPPATAPYRYGPRPGIPESARGAAPLFSEQQAAMGLRRGVNTILARAVVSLPDGSERTCAGEPTTLIPATDFARYRMAALYGGADQITIDTAPRLPREPAFERYVLHATCDANGGFRFDHLADGSYFITLRIRPGRGLPDLSLKREVTVRGGGIRTVRLGD